MSIFLNIEINISYYIKNYLHVYREEQKDAKHVYPHHYKLPPEGIVKLIAKDNALMLVFANLYALKNFKIETIEDCMERLNNNFGYEEIQHDYERFKTTVTNPNIEIIEEKAEVAQPVVMSKQQDVESLKPKHLNSNQRIFVNNECYIFFKSLQKSVRERYKLADYSFIFRRMQKDSYIYKYVTTVYILLLYKYIHCKYMYMYIYILLLYIYNI